MAYPQLELYIKGAIVANRLREIKSVSFWLPPAAFGAIIGGIGASYMPSVVVGGVVWAILESKRSGTLMRALREGDPPVVYTLHRIRKWLPSGQLEATLGTEACEILERCASATRRILSYHAPETLGNMGVPSEEARRVAAVADEEMTAALRIAGRPLMFKLPPDDAILEELKSICAGLEQLAGALSEERKALRESALPGLLEELEERKQARLELGS